MTLNSPQDWHDPAHPDYARWLEHRRKYRAIVQRDHRAFVDAYATAGIRSRSLGPCVRQSPMDEDDQFPVARALTATVPSVEPRA